MVFTGTYEHTIDAKQRVAIPSEVRSQIKRAEGVDAGGSIGLYVTLGDDSVLCLYTDSGFERRAAELDDSTADADELLEYERLLFSLARRVELDKQGRIRIPETLLEQTQLGSEVVLLGVKDHLEIRDRKAWKAYVDQIRRDRPQLLMNPRRVMRRGPRDG